MTPPPGQRPVPLEGAGGKLTSTISSPIQVHGVAKVPARRAPALGEHTEAVLQQLGFSASDIDGLRASGATPKASGPCVTWSIGPAPKLRRGHWSKPMIRTPAEGVGRDSRRLGLRID